ncbi:MAG: hypothetical protein HY314_11075 [Acidobacteria bacterium]|nr:hypothetical protein [Acidobacteriota bacterium]
MPGQTSKKPCHRLGHNLTLAESWPPSAATTVLAVIRTIVVIIVGTILMVPAEDSG